MMATIAPFAFRPEPLPDELLSSWMLRTAAGMLMKPYDFTHTYWRSKPPALTRDIDRMAPANIITGMAEGTGIPLARAYQTTLGGYAGSLFGEMNAQGFAPWIMPVGVRHRSRQSFGQQFCPKCLAEDERPYFRRAWRIATSSVCVRHEVVLADRCPDCGESVAAHRSPRLDRCWKCECALRDAVTRVADPEVLRLQAGFELAIKNGWAVLGQGVVHFAPRYFLLVRQLLSLVSHGPRRTRFLRAIGEHRWAHRMPGGPIEPAGGIEYLTPSARHDHFAMVAWLLWGWPDLFVEAAQKAGIWQSWALKDMRDVPWDYQRAVRPDLVRASYQPTDGEISAAIGFLDRTRDRVWLDELVELIGDNKDLKQKGLVKFVNEFRVMAG